MRSGGNSLGYFSDSPMSIFNRHFRLGSWAPWDPFVYASDLYWVRTVYMWMSYWSEREIQLWWRTQLLHSIDSEVDLAVFSIFGWTGASTKTEAAQIRQLQTAVQNVLLCWRLYGMLRESLLGACSIAFSCLRGFLVWKVVGAVYADYPRRSPISALAVRDGLTLLLNRF